LAQGRPVNLIGPDVPTPAYLWWAGHGRVWASPEEPQTRAVTFTAAEHSMIEPLPRSPRAAYRLTARLRQKYGGNPNGTVGVYFGNVRITTTEGPQDFCGLASFTDLGLNATAARDTAGRPSGRLGLDLLHLGNSRRKPFRVYTHLARSIFYRPKHPLTPPGDWHDLTLEVRADQVLVAWDGQTAALTPPTEWPYWLGELRLEYPDLREAKLRWDAYGALGILVYGASAEVMHLRLEPLPNP
jgi:hypothetical protein